MERGTRARLILSSHAMDGKKMPRKLPKTITEAEFLEGLYNVKSPTIKLAFVLGFYQCMRVSEVVKVCKEDVDQKRGFIHIVQSKGKKDRYIPIMPPTKHGLRNLPVPIGIRQLQRVVKKYWPHIHFHTLRHSGATFYHNIKGLSIRFVQQFLGHSRLDTTQIYTHVTPKDLQDKMIDIW